MAISLTDLFVLFGLKNSQLLLLDPFSIDLTLFGCGLLFIGVIDFNSFVLVVFLKSKSLGLFGLWLNYFNLFSRLGLIGSLLVG